MTSEINKPFKNKACKIREINQFFDKYSSNLCARHSENCLLYTSIFKFTRMDKLSSSKDRKRIWDKNVNRQHCPWAKKGEVWLGKHVVVSIKMPYWQWTLAITLCSPQIPLSHDEPWIMLSSSYSYLSTIPCCRGVTDALHKDKVSSPIPNYQLILILSFLLSPANFHNFQLTQKPESIYEFYQNSCTYTFTFLLN